MLFHKHLMISWRRSSLTRTPWRRPWPARRSGGPRGGARGCPFFLPFQGIDVSACSSFKGTLADEASQFENVGMNLDFGNSLDEIDRVNLIFIFKRIHVIEKFRASKKNRDGRTTNDEGRVIPMEGICCDFRFPLLPSAATSRFISLLHFLCFVFVSFRMA